MKNYSLADVCESERAIPENFKSWHKAEDWIDSIEKGKAIHRAIQYHSIEDRLTSLFHDYPETQRFTHAMLASLIGCSRRAVTIEMLNLGYRGNFNNRRKVA